MATINVSNELWNIINKERINSTETMEDVIWRWKNLLDERRQQEDGE